MSKQFSEYNRFNLSDINKEILEKWDKENIFQQSLDMRAGAPSFVFYEGPPSANGMPGIHHVMARAVKDIFCRYKTMKGFLVNRKAGWDTHGLPVELAVEKKLGITKEDIGKCVAFLDDFEAYAGGDIIILRPENVNSRFLGYYLNSESINRQKASKGQGDAVVHITANALADVDLMMPSVDEQFAIASVLSDMDAELSSLEEKLMKVRHLKNGMMRNLLTGKIRLVIGSKF